MSTGDILRKYGSSSNLTVTALQSLAASATWVAGWESALIDNSSAGYDDFAITAKIIVGAAPTAGEVRMYLVAMLDDSTWPDVFDGTESVETITSTGIRDAICKFAASIATDATASRSYYLHCPSAKLAFGGSLPAKFIVFITHSTVQALAAAGQQVTVKGSYDQVQA